MLEISHVHDSGRISSEYTALLLRLWLHKVIEFCQLAWPQLTAWAKDTTAFGYLDRISKNLITNLDNFYHSPEILLTMYADNDVQADGAFKGWLKSQMSTY